MFKLFPREETFLPQFLRAAEVIVEASKALDDLMSDYRDVDVKVQRIKHLEHEGDRIAHQTFDLLARTWITPIDREDIHSLVTALDDVLDFLDAGAARFVLFRIPAPTAEAAAITKLLVQAAVAQKDAVSKLADLKDSKAILDSCVEINRIENEIDSLNRLAIGKLFDNEKDPITIMKWKEIYEVLETASDRCEDVANVLEQIVIKSS